MPMDINLSLSFFADLLRTDEKNLNYTIIRRKNNGIVKRHPGLTVEGIDKYAFDLYEGRFVKLGNFGNGSVSLEKRTDIVKKDDGGLIFWDKFGHMIDYTVADFRKVYVFRFVNPALYE